MKPMLRFSSMNFLRASCSDAEREYMRPTVSSSQTVDLVFRYFTFHFLFSFCLFSYFSIFRTTRVRVDQLHCQSQSDGIVTKQITRLGRI